MGAQLTAPEPQAAPLQFPHGSHTRTCPVIGSRAVLAQGCPVIQIPCYEKAEASRASWGQICHVALDSSCRLTLPKPTMQSETLEEPPAAANPSVSQSLTSSAQLSVPHRFGCAACRVEVTCPHHTPSITQHCYRAPTGLKT